VLEVLVVVPHSVYSSCGAVTNLPGSENRRHLSGGSVFCYYRMAIALAMYHMCIGEGKTSLAVPAGVTAGGLTVGTMIIWVAYLIK
jgi:uncharacterized sodium:solute symporter family permease YidK